MLGRRKNNAHDPLTVYSKEPYFEVHTRKGVLENQTVAPKQRQPLAIPLEDRPAFVDVTCRVRREVADALESLREMQCPGAMAEDTSERTHEKNWRGEILETYAVTHVPATFGLSLYGYTKLRLSGGGTMRELRRMARAVLQRTYERLEAAL